MEKKIKVKLLKLIMLLKERMIMIVREFNWWKFKIFDLVDCCWGGFRVRFWMGGFELWEC